MCDQIQVLGAAASAAEPKQDYSEFDPFAPPEQYIGCYVAVWWNSIKWYVAKVTKYSSSQGVFLQYNDGDQRWIKSLALRTFRFVGSSSIWHAPVPSELRHGGSWTTCGLCVADTKPDAKRREGAAAAAAATESKSDATMAAASAVVGSKSAPSASSSSSSATSGFELLLSRFRPLLSAYLLPCLDDLCVSLTQARLAGVSTACRKFCADSTLWTTLRLPFFLPAFRDGVAVGSAGTPREGKAMPPHSFAARRVEFRNDVGDREADFADAKLPPSVLLARLCAERPGLKSLHIQGWPYRFANATLVGCFRQLPLLEDVSLEGLSFSARTLQSLATSCPNLRRLALSAATIDHSGLGEDQDKSVVDWWKALSTKCRRLDTLDLRGCKGYVAEDTMLISFPELRVLYDDWGGLWRYAPKLEEVHTSLSERQKTIMSMCSYEGKRKLPRVVLDRTRVHIIQRASGSGVPTPTRSFEVQPRGESTLTESALATELIQRGFAAADSALEYSGWDSETGHRSVYPCPDYLGSELHLFLCAESELPVARGAAAQKAGAADSEWAV